ncbi:hypothetical protein [Modestobacter lacusdianchii]
MTDASSEDLQLLVDDVRKGDSSLAGVGISIDDYQECGAVSLPSDLANSPRVIVFLIKVNEGWQLISPTQGVVAFEESTYESIDA